MYNLLRNDFLVNLKPDDATSLVKHDYAALKKYELQNQNLTKFSLGATRPSKKKSKKKKYKTVLFYHTECFRY